jgi:hypothetical protein
MKFEHIPQDRFIVNSIIRIIGLTNGGDHANPTYNSGISFGIEELVKQNMRQLSQEGEVTRGWQGLLGGSLERSAV